ncbi:MAG: hypothetical protein FWE28_01310 [Oscillospiraceae bacterium]|nr:hypothetical protein [Oscillospiraceae bacterium]
MKKGLLLLLILTILFLTGCGFGGNTSDPQPTLVPEAEETQEAPPAPTVSQLVGTWHMVMPMDLGAGLLNYDFTVTYSLDGTGRETISYPPLNWMHSVDFTWIASNGEVTVTMSEGGVTSTVTSAYNVLGDVLTSFRDSETHALNRVQ